MSVVAVLKNGDRVTLAPRLGTPQTVAELLTSGAMTGSAVQFVETFGGGQLLASEILQLIPSAR